MDDAAFPIGLKPAKGVPEQAMKQAPKPPCQRNSPQLDLATAVRGRCDIGSPLNGMRPSFQDAQARLTNNITDDIAQLDIHFEEGLLHVMNSLRTGNDQVVP